MARKAGPAIIKKITEEAGHGHHGGAWKVAYADFVTAMMAFFLMLWLLSTADKQTLKGLAAYFSDAKIETGPPGGLGGVLDGITVRPEINVQAPASPFNTQPTLPFTSDGELDEDVAELGYDQASALDEASYAAERQRREAEEFEAAKARLLDAVAASPQLEGLKQNLLVERTPEGLRIELVDRDRSSMFPLGSEVMYPQTAALLGAVAKAVAALPNRLSIRGHTDATPFAAGAARDNWQLSASRANATRRVLIESGLDARRIAEVVGKADAEPLTDAAPGDPRNRRISIVLLHAAPPAGNG